MKVVSVAFISYFSDIYLFLFPLKKRYRMVRGVFCCLVRFYLSISVWILVPFSQLFLTKPNIKKLNLPGSEGGGGGRE
jgi:hypothetical protein